MPLGEGPSQEMCVCGGGGRPLESENTVETAVLSSQRSPVSATKVRQVTRVSAASRHSEDFMFPPPWAPFAVLFVFCYFSPLLVALACLLWGFLFSFVVVYQALTFFFFLECLSFRFFHFFFTPVYIFLEFSVSFLSFSHS